MSEETIRRDLYVAMFNLVLNLRAADALPNGFNRCPFCNATMRATFEPSGLMIHVAGEHAENCPLHLRHAPKPFFPNA